MSESKKQTVTGVVERLSSAQTIRISTKVTKVHPLYRKRYSVTRHYVAHNPSKELAIGDVVTIESCRPISKSKHWLVIG